MKKTAWIVLVVVLFSAMLLSACGGGNGNGATERQSPPAEYANMTNPFEGDAAAVASGQELYVVNCASCHGEDAQGGGPAGAALDPQPGNLVETASETDPNYQHWVISEGGAAAGLSPSMVAYKGILSDDEIWQIVTYLESTFDN